jgi:hypothetical protein
METRWFSPVLSWLKNLTLHIPRKGMETLLCDVSTQIRYHFSSFDITYSPQGDGNVACCQKNSGINLAKFDITYSPQGDGNVSFEDVAHHGGFDITYSPQGDGNGDIKVHNHVLLCLTLHIPREGVETGFNTEFKFASILNLTLHIPRKGMETINKQNVIVVS